MGATYEDEIAELINTSSVAVDYWKTERLADNVRLVQQHVPTSGFPRTLSDTANISATTSYALVGALADRMRVGQVDAAAFIQLLHDTYSISLTTNLGRPASLADTVNVSLIAAAANGVLVAERLGLSDPVTGNWRGTFSLAQLVRLSDVAGQFAALSASDSVNLHDAMAGVYRPLSLLAETVDIHDSAAPVLLVSVITADHVTLTDALLAQAFYDAQLSDIVDLTIAMVDPSGDVTTWAINTRTGAATEYRNYDFNSFAQMGVHYLGASRDGIYQLDGATDAGTSIIAQLKSGFAQFGGSHFASIKAAYLGVRGGGNFTLRLTTGDGKTYDYAITSAHDMATTKIHIGKGLRARYFAFELISSGQDFDLDSIEFVPIVMQRRV